MAIIAIPPPFLSVMGQFLFFLVVMLRLIARYKNNILNWAIL